MFIIMIALIGMITPAVAQEQAASMTVSQCRTILLGLNALNCAGQQIRGSCAPDAKQYKLGGARITIALDVHALSEVIEPIENGQNAFVREQPPLPPPTDKGRQDAETENGKRIAANWAAAMARPCNVKLGRLSVKDLHVGDSQDENAIPPEVISAILPIVDGLK